MTQRIRKSEAKSPELDNAIPPQQRGEPSWFLSQTSPFSREELLANYRKSRQLPDNPLEPPRPSARTAEYRDLVTARPRPPARFLEVHEVKYGNWDTEPQENNHSHRKEPAKGLSLAQTFAVAAAMALVSGATVGFVSSQMKDVSVRVAGLFGSTASAKPAVTKAETAPAATITAAVPPKPRKSVSTATLRVDDAQGQTRSYIPLSLSAEPGFAGGDIILKISGLPESAYLTSGQRNGTTAWSLRMADLKDLKLVVPAAEQPELDLAVAAFETKTGELAAPVKTMRVALSDVVVQPVSAPPPAQAAPQAEIPSTLPQAQAVAKDGHPSAIPEPKGVSLTLALAQERPAAALALKGDELLRAGDIEAARKSYSAAWGQGAGEGAFGLGRSYDPVVLTALNLEGIRPDTEKAIAWYELAVKAGVSNASNAIVRLKLKP